MSRYAVTIGTAAFRAIDANTVLAGNEVAYTTEITGPMVWDAALGNIRPMTASEISALPAQQKAARDAGEPDLATLRDNATAAFNANVTYLAIASPSNAQVAAQVKALTQQHQQIIKALARLCTRILP